MSIEQLVLNYREFLLASWPFLNKILWELDWDKHPYFLDEWLQANWELLVESQLGNAIRLSPYGFNRAPEASASEGAIPTTNEVVCIVKEGSDAVRHRFLSFVAADGETYKTAPPFDYVNVEAFDSHTRGVLPLKDVRFEIASI